MDSNQSDDDDDGYAVRFRFSFLSMFVAPLFKRCRWSCLVKSS